MTEDPRCPSCGGKVSATARWCMHCSADFVEPADASASRDGEVTLSTSRDRESAGGFPASDDPREAPDVTGTVESDTGTVDTDTGVVDTDTGTVATDAGTTEGTEPTGDRSPVESWRPEGDATGSVSALAPLVTFFDADEIRRGLLVLGIPLALWAALGTVAPGFPVLALAGSIALGVYLFTRRRAAETLSGGLSGAGVLLVAVQLLALAQAGLADGQSIGTDLLADAAPVLLAGVALLVVGRWLGAQRFY